MSDLSLDIWFFLRWILLAFAVLLFLFARAAFFVAIVGGLVSGVLGGTLFYFLFDGDFLLGFLLCGCAGGFIGMLASLHSGTTIGKLGENHSFHLSGFLAVISYPGYLLNLIQFFFQCPWRAWLKNYDSLFSRFSRTGFGKVILWLLKILFYLLSIPLRFGCAVYYNLFVRLLSILTDVFLEFMIPKAEGMRSKPFFIYLLLWIVKLPWRFLKFIVWKSGLSIVESIFFTVYDTIVPTLTMYHGTSEEACTRITTRGNWKVGSGNFVGDGVYFAIYKRTADHYQKMNSTGVIIVCRVSLGRILNMSQAPREIRNMVASNGAGITQFGLSKGFNATEWWRKDGGWWEYCLLDPGGSYDHPWRIRELYVYYADSGMKKRIFGSMASWFFH